MQKRPIGFGLVLAGFIISGLVGLAQSAPPNQTQTETFSQLSYIRQVLQKVAVCQVAHPKHTPTDRTNGAFYAGVCPAWETTRSPVILDSLLALGERTGWQPGPRYDYADDITICQTYIDLYRLKKSAG